MGPHKPTIEKTLNTIQRQEHFVTSDGRLLSIEQRLYPTVIWVHEALITDTATPAKRHTTAMDGSRGILDWAFSPDGDRLAIVVRMVVRPTRVSPIPRILAEIIPIAEQYTVEIRTCRIDGLEMRTLGVIPESASTAKDRTRIITTDQFPLALRWLPDGKRLSFAYRNALWTIPSR